MFGGDILYSECETNLVFRCVIEKCDEFVFDETAIPSILNPIICHRMGFDQIFFYLLPKAVISMFRPQMAVLVFFILPPTTLCHDRESN